VNYPENQAIAVLVIAVLLDFVVYLAFHLVQLVLFAVFLVVVGYFVSLVVFLIVF